MTATLIRRFMLALFLGWLLLAALAGLDPDPIPLAVEDISARPSPPTEAREAPFVHPAQQLQFCAPIGPRPDPAPPPSMGPPPIPQSVSKGIV